jgi:hypothetical protein
MAQYLHPEVAAEQALKREAEPNICHYAAGAVGPTAGRPQPRWCVRPLGHEGLHMPEERYQGYRALARDRQRRHRGRGR